MIKIYSLNNSTYSRLAVPLSSNHKRLELRWIHKTNNGLFKSVSENDALDYEIRWYRYKLGASSADEYSGVYWSLLSRQWV